MVFLSLIIGTLVSEDLTCIAAGILVRDGRIGLAAAIASCAAGIFIGDVGLWLVGRVCRVGAARWSLTRAVVARWRLDERRRQLEGNVAAALLASRFIPGSRLPLYLAAGFSGVRLRTFSSWTCIAVLLWTPVLVLAAAEAGNAALQSPAMDSSAWASRTLAGAVFFAVLLSIRIALRWLPSPAAKALIGRWSRWEFWPMWLFYAPVTVWIALLSLRHRGISTITAANPGIPDGGTVGESKSQILSRLPADSIVSSALIERGAPSCRLTALHDAIDRSAWSFPLVLKPDVGQRGIGVKLVSSPEEALSYLEVQQGAVLAQPYHSGPFEAGVFYYRYPHQSRGRILSITDKQFPFVIGDGVSTLASLIDAHPRYRLQARTFLTRHRASLDLVLPPGERFQLAHAGNHAQGTMFRDGMHLWTEALEGRIDTIAQSFHGFFVGRFDIRYADVEEFRHGRGFSIVELNGATAESTDIYDPGGSLWRAYRRLFQQWSIVFGIGAANRRRGAHVSSLRRLAGLVRAHLRARVAFEVSD